MPALPEKRHLRKEGQSTAPLKRNGQTVCYRPAWEKREKVEEVAF